MDAAQVVGLDLVGDDQQPAVGRRPWSLLCRRSGRVSFAGSPPRQECARSVRRCCRSAPSRRGSVRRFDLPSKCRTTRRLPVVHVDHLERRLDPRRVVGVRHLGELRQRRLDVRERRGLGDRVLCAESARPIMYGACARYGAAAGVTSALRPLPRTREIDEVASRSSGRAARRHCRDDLPRRSVLHLAVLQRYQTVAVDHHIGIRRAGGEVLGINQPALRCGSTPAPSKAMFAAMWRSPERWVQA